MASARSYVLRLLKQRLRSRAELVSALEKRGVDTPEIEELLAEIEEAGLINDSRLARAWVNDRDRFNPRGEFVLRQELKKKGIAEEIIREVLRDRKQREEEPVDEFEQAKQVAQTRERLYARLTPEQRRRRLGGFLLRRGFSSDTVRRILDA